MLQEILNMSIIDLIIIGFKLIIASAICSFVMAILSLTGLYIVFGPQFRSQKN